MKKYLASLACLEPVNWEIRLEAKNERQAVKKARAAFDEYPNDGEFVETGMGARLDLRDNSGIYVEEVGDDSK